MSWKLRTFVWHSANVGISPDMSELLLWFSNIFRERVLLLSWFIRNKLLPNSAPSIEARRDDAKEKQPTKWSEPIDQRFQRRLCCRVSCMFIHLIIRFEFSPLRILSTMIEQHEIGKDQVEWMNKISFYSTSFIHISEATTLWTQVTQHCKHLHPASQSTSAARPEFSSDSDSESDSSLDSNSDSDSQIEIEMKWNEDIASCLWRNIRFR